MARGPRKATPKRVRRRRVPVHWRRARSRFSWESIPDKELLDWRLCDLGLTVEGSWLEEPIAQVLAELEARQLKVRPHFWLSEEWFSPADVPGIAIPFYLAHPRLLRLERKFMLEVEGGSIPWCLKILRHELGHVIQHAYQVQRRRRWQALFGKSSKQYPEYYRPHPRSKRYVLHLDRWYAQAHPDEDFAETFAVWFQPGGSWRKRYRKWPALKKLEYVDELMGELAGAKPTISTRATVDSLGKLRKTLRQFYDEKCDRYSVSYPRIYDRELKRVFSDDPEHKAWETAGMFLRRNRAEIRKVVSRWTGEYQFTLDQVLKDIMVRCKELGLRAVGSERRLKLDFSIFLTVQTMNCLFTGREWHAL